MINDNVSFFGAKFGNVGIFVVSAVLSIVSWFYIIKNIMRKFNLQNKFIVKIIIYIGQNTLIILCIHQIFINVIRVIERMILHITFPYSVSTFFVLIANVLAAKFINNHLGWTVGKRK